MQGKRYLGAIFTGLAALSVAASSFATMSMPDGWYLEANVGSSRLSNYNHPGKISANGVGGSLNLGYKFMPYFGLEINYSRYANGSIKTSAGNKAGTDKFYSYGIAGRGILPLQDTGFELFARLGIQRINSRITVSNAVPASTIGLTNSTNNATGLLIGAGGQYYVLPQLALVAQWQRAQGSNKTGNEDLFSGGVSFIFS